MFVFDVNVIYDLNDVGHLNVTILGRWVILTTSKLKVSQLQNN